MRRESPSTVNTIILFLNIYFSRAFLFYRSLIRQVWICKKKKKKKNHVVEVEGKQEFEDFKKHSIYFPFPIRREKKKLATCEPRSVCNNNGPTSLVKKKKKKNSSSAVICVYTRKKQNHFQRFAARFARKQRREIIARTSCVLFFLFHFLSTFVPYACAHIYVRAHE